MQIHGMSAASKEEVGAPYDEYKRESFSRKEENNTGIKAKRRRREWEWKQETDMVCKV